MPPAVLRGTLMLQPLLVAGGVVDGAPALVDGAPALVDGAPALADGAPPLPELAPPVPAGGLVKVQYGALHFAPSPMHLQSASVVHQPSLPAVWLPAGLQ